MQSLTALSRRRRMLVASAALATVAIALTACTSSPSGNASGGSADRSKTLTLALGGTPPSLDPAALDNGDSAYIWSSVFDTLISYDAKTGNMVPNAATSWKYSDGNKTLTLKLRSGMTFSTGEKVTASAVVDTLERDMKTPGTRAGELTHFDSVEAPDASTVVIHLKTPDPALLANLAAALGVVGDPKTLADKRTALNPVGSGPYTLDESATVTGSKYVLQRRNDYWNAKAYPFKTVTLRVITDAQAAYNALLAGEIDSGQVQLDQKSAIEAAGLKTQYVDASALGNLLFLDKTGKIVPALADKRVRQAINMAFDRKAIIKAILGGAGVPTDQVFNPALTAYDKSLDNHYTYDVRKAKQMLADAGYPDGFAVTMPSTYLSTQFEPALTQALGDIGIKVTWDPVPPQDVASSLSSGKYGMAWFFDGLATPAREASNEYSTTGFLNPFGYTTPELDGLFDKIALAPDQASSDKLYRELNKYAVENALSAPVLYVGTLHATKAGIRYTTRGGLPIRLISFQVG